MIQRIFKVLCVTLLIGVSHSFAGFYLKPSAGVVIPVENNSSLDNQASLGITAGYQFIKVFAVEGSYNRFIETNTLPNANTFRGTFIARIPTGVFAPYASIGTGMIDYDIAGAANNRQYMTTFGIGMQIVKLFKFAANVGAELALVDNGPNFIEPRASLGVHF